MPVPMLMLIKPPHPLPSPKKVIGNENESESEYCNYAKYHEIGYCGIIRRWQLTVGRGSWQLAVGSWQLTAPDRRGRVRV